MKTVLAYLHFLKKDINWETMNAEQVKSKTAYNKALEDVEYFIKNQELGQHDPDFIKGIKQALADKVK